MIASDVEVSDMQKSFRFCCVGFNEIHFRSRHLTDSQKSNHVDCWFVSLPRAWRLDSPHCNLPSTCVEYWSMSANRLCLTSRDYCRVTRKRRDVVRRLLFSSSLSRWIYTTELINAQQQYNIVSTLPKDRKTDDCCHTGGNSPWTERDIRCRAFESVRTTLPYDQLPGYSNLDKCPIEYWLPSVKLTHRANHYSHRCTYDRRVWICHSEEGSSVGLQTEWQLPRDWSEHEENASHQVERTVRHARENHRVESEPCRRWWSAWRRMDLSHSTPRREVIYDWIYDTSRAINGLLLRRSDKQTTLIHCDWSTSPVTFPRLPLVN